VLEGDNVVRTSAPNAAVHIGPRCHLVGVVLDTAGEVAIAQGVHVRGPLVVDGPGRVVFGEGCRVDSGSGGNAVHAVGPDATVAFGIECYLNGVDVFATEDVTIGDRCIVGECSFVTTDFHSTDPDRWSPNAPVGTGPIVVGSNVWIAARTFVTKGVTIGPNSVVSIGTIVREDVPADVIVSSQEQRVVKTLPRPSSGDAVTWPTWWTRPEGGV